MPIICRVPLRPLNQHEFGELSYSVLNDVFTIHNQLGQFFNERIYKQALAARREGVLLEEPIEVTFSTFFRRYFVDVLVGYGGIFEFKTVHRFVPRHRAQLLHYVLLDGLKHGMLINVRPERVEHEFVNTVLQLTAFENPDALVRFRTHAERVLAHTKLRALLWINIARRRITFSLLA